VTPVDREEGGTMAWRDGAVALWMLFRCRFTE
jgi:hypothetical protein